MWEHKHRGSVYNLAWGPNLKPPLGVKLYSCGDNVILMHHGQKGSRPSNVEDVIEETNALKRKVGEKMGPRLRELSSGPAGSRSLGVAFFTITCTV